MHVRSLRVFIYIYIKGATSEGTSPACHLRTRLKTEKSCNKSLKKCWISPQHYHHVHEPYPTSLGSAPRLLLLVVGELHCFQAQTESWHHEQLQTPAGPGGKLRRVQGHPRARHDRKKPARCCGCRRKECLIAFVVAAMMVCGGFAGLYREAVSTTICSSTPFPNISN